MSPLNQFTELARDHEIETLAAQLRQGSHSTVVTSRFLDLTQRVADERDLTLGSVTRFWLAAK